MSLIEMHREANIVSLEQRRYIQLLCLMYIYRGALEMWSVYLLEIQDRGVAIISGS